MKNIVMFKGALIWLLVVALDVGLADDPGQAFDARREYLNLSEGRSVWVRSEIKQDWLRTAFDDMAQPLRITNGRITFDQDIAYVRMQSASDTAADQMSFQTQINVNEVAPRELENWENDVAPMDLRRPLNGKRNSARKQLPDSIATLDANGDGQLSFFEWRLQRPIAEFVKLDRNNDGLVTAEEAESQTPTSPVEMKSVSRR